MSGVTMQVQGMYTAATGVRGGVTTYDANSAGSGPRKAENYNPGVPDFCWDCVDENEDGICDRCGHEIVGGCTCGEESGYCWCPIGDGWDVWIMMAVMAISYVLFMRRRNEKMQNNLHN